MCKAHCKRHLSLTDFVRPTARCSLVLLQDLFFKACGYYYSCLCQSPPLDCELVGTASFFFFRLFCFMFNIYSIKVMS